MKVDLFDFALPRSLIATHPAVPRDAARLLVADGALEDRVVADLPELLDPGDLLVLNQTRVIPARLKGALTQPANGSVDITLHRKMGPDCWDAFAKPARKLKPGREICFAEDFTATVETRGEGGEVRLRFSLADGALRTALSRYGTMPLPPYIPRPHGPEPRDREDYQTVYAVDEGAIAAPTAGLHFTERLLDRLEAHGISRVLVTLHVGAGTFLPVKVEDTRDHRLLEEWGRIDAAAVDAINRTRAAGGRIVAVGTTSLRLLETAADDEGNVRPFEGETSLFITPGYRFTVADRLLTNFHLPRSTLFMLVAAFAGLDHMKAAYEHAKTAGYRFYSYGDACLLRRMAP